MNQAQRELIRRNKAVPNYQQIADEMGKSVETVRLLHHLSQPELSLDTVFRRDKEGSVTLGDMIPDKSSLPTSDQGIQLYLTEQVRGSLGRLSERERLVLNLRFGLDDGRPRTLDEVGEEMGVTRERIRQIEMRGFNKLRRLSRHLRDYLAT